MLPAAKRAWEMLDRQSIATQWPMSTFLTQLRTLSRNPFRKETGVTILVRFCWFEQYMSELQSNGPQFWPPTKGEVVFPIGSADAVTEPPDWKPLMNRYKRQVQEVAKTSACTRSCLEEDA